MTRRMQSWPRMAGDSQRPARSTTYKDKCRRLRETNHRLANMSPWISPSEFPHPPYTNNTTSLHGIASLDSLTTSHSSTNPFSVNFQGTGLGHVPASSYTYYVADCTNTPISKRHPVQNMTGFCSVTIDNVQSAYPGWVIVPNALNAYTSVTKHGQECCCIWVELWKNPDATGAETRTMGWRWAQVYIHIHIHVEWFLCL